MRTGKITASGKPDAYESILQPRKHATKGIPLSFDEAVAHVQHGGDVYAKNKKTAYRIAKAAGNTEPVHDNPHLPGQHPHYHPTRNGQRCGGHVLY
jgi:hypothetical protein